MFDKRTRHSTIIVAAALLASAAAPALADVKDGVDAWSRGDYVAAVAEWNDAAAGGDADAQFNLAQAYRLGRGVEADAARARDLYERAAAQGHLKAADNYGLLLFQQGERERAMPYIDAAAKRGDPRAQYVQGLAHFNGDLADKNWVRAYALVSLAQAAGLPQATNAIRQMDQYIAIDDRQQAQLVAAQLKRDADAQRTAQLAAADLATGAPQRPVEPTPRVPRPVANLPLPASSAATPSPAQASPASAGADFARPQTPVLVAGTIEAATRPAAPAPVAVPTPVANDGPWRVQLGAFGVKGNAERLWGKLSATSALSGKKPFYVPVGKLTKLQAGGFASRADAAKACAALKGSGQACIVTK